LTALRDVGAVQGSKYITDIQLQWEKKLKATTIGLALCLLLLAGCVGTHYVPATFNPKENRYQSMANVDKDRIKTRDTSVDLRKFKITFLLTDSNVHPGRLEFAVRDVLVRAGLRNITNRDELLRFVNSRADTKEFGQLDAVALKKLSEKVGPVLVIDVRSMWDGDVRRYTGIRAVDSGSDRTLLELTHPKFIWLSVDGEAHYPLFNELHSWVQDSLAQARKG
jgi:hypothetical protein